MGADYVAAVAVRYALLLAACAIAGRWVLPASWEGPAGLVMLAYVVAVAHAEPAARYARRAARPWIAWTFLFAACAHALGAALAYPFLDVLELRFHRPPGGGMDFQTLWYDVPTAPEVGTWVLIYALFAALFAVAVGAASRAAFGAEPPGASRIRIRSARATGGAVGHDGRMT